MKKFSVILLIGMICSITGPLAPGPAFAENSGIDWLSYGDGMQKGKKQGKKVFLSFYADWCRYCKMMDSTTFQNSDVVGYINENYIPVRVNSDQSRKVAADFQVRGVPVFWFVAENGEKIGSRDGYVPPDQMLPLLKYVYTESFKTMSLEAFMSKM